MSNLCTAYGPPSKPFNFRFIHLQVLFVVDADHHDQFRHPCALGAVDALWDQLAQVISDLLKSILKSIENEIILLRLTISKRDFFAKTFFLLGFTISKRDLFCKIKNRN